MPLTTQGKVKERVLLDTALSLKNDRQLIDNTLNHEYKDSLEEQHLLHLATQSNASLDALKTIVKHTNASNAVLRQIISIHSNKLDSSLITSIAEKSKDIDVIKGIINNPRFSDLITPGIIHEINSTKILSKLDQQELRKLVNCQHSNPKLWKNIIDSTTDQEIIKAIIDNKSFEKLASKELINSIDNKFPLTSFDILQQTILAKCDNIDKSLLKKLINSTADQKIIKAIIDRKDFEKLDKSVITAICQNNAALQNITEENLTKLAIHKFADIDNLLNNIDFSKINDVTKIFESIIPRHPQHLNAISEKIKSLATQGKVSDEQMIYLQNILINPTFKATRPTEHSDDGLSVHEDLEDDTTSRHDDVHEDREDDTTSRHDDVREDLEDDTAPRHDDVHEDLEDDTASRHDDVHEDLEDSAYATMEIEQPNEPTEAAKPQGLFDKQFKQLELNLVDEKTTTFSPESWQKYFAKPENQQLTVTKLNDTKSAETEPKQTTLSCATQGNTATISDSNDSTKKLMSISGKTISFTGDQDENVAMAVKALQAISESNQAGKHYKISFPKSKFTTEDLLRILHKINEQQNNRDSPVKCTVEIIKLDHFPEELQKIIKIHNENAKKLQINPDAKISPLPDFKQTLENISSKQASVTTPKPEESKDSTTDKVLGAADTISDGASIAAEVINTLSNFRPF